jgi:hypothetical protein
LIGVGRVSDQQNVASIMGGTSKVKNALHVQEQRASLCDEDSPCVGELHTDNPSISASEELKSMLFFDLSDLFAERRLGDVQSVGGPSKVQFLGQNNDGVQVTCINVGEHGKPQGIDSLLFVYEAVHNSERFPHRSDGFSVWWLGFGTAL